MALHLGQRSVVGFVWVCFQFLFGVPLIEVSVPLPVPHCLITVVVYEAIIMGRVILQTSFYFFKIVLTLLGPLFCRLNFRISLSISMKLSGILMGLH